MIYYLEHLCNQYFIDIYSLFGNLTTKEHIMSLRSYDCKPIISYYLRNKFYLVSIPHREISQYKPDQIVITVYYRIPVLGTKGVLIMDEKFKTVQRNFVSYTVAQRFYKQKMISYNARKNARYERLYNENIKYFAQIKQMQQL